MGLGLGLGLGLGFGFGLELGLGLGLALGVGLGWELGLAGMGVRVMKRMRSSPAATPSSALSSPEKVTLGVGLWVRGGVRARARH